MLHVELPSASLHPADEQQAQEPAGGGHGGADERRSDKVEAETRQVVAQREEQGRDEGKDEVDLRPRLLRAALAGDEENPRHDQRRADRGERREALAEG